MSYYFTRFIFLFCIAGSIVGAAYALLSMACGDTGEASKALFMTVVGLMLAKLSHWEMSEDSLPEYQYQYRGK